MFFSNTLLRKDVQPYRKLNIANEETNHRNTPNDRFIELYPFFDNQTISSR